MTRFALTADLQFNTQAGYSTLLPSGITTRLRDTIEAFEWVVATATERGCEALLALGDIFDSRVQIDVSVLDQTCRAFQLASESIDVHVLVGNHDSYLRTPAMNSLQALTAYATVHEEVTEWEQFAFVPWTDDADVYADLCASAAETDAAVFLSHAMFEGAVPMAKGLPLDLIEEGRWDMAFLGDVHDPVCVREDPLVQYCGAPLQIHFGDAGGDRGFWIYDDEADTVEFIANDVSPRFHTVRSLDELQELADVITTDRDFLWLNIEDADELDEARDLARSMSSWVRATTKPSKRIRPRLKVSARMTDEELVRAYCERVGMEDEATIERGVRLMKEARSA
tara:strand:- start:9834 stop:10853 length:1020 start_codon:yes stop_codon:yes gene_type:complete